MKRPQSRWIHVRTRKIAEVQELLVLAGASWVDLEMRGFDKYGSFLLPTTATYTVPDATSLHGHSSDTPIGQGRAKAGTQVVVYRCDDFWWARPLEEFLTKYLPYPEEEEEEER